MPRQRGAALSLALLRDPRRLARRSLLHFTNYTYPQYRAEPAHALIAQTLQDVVAGRHKRLMIFAPPQSGKSELSSVRLPAYWLGRRPDDPVILASYGATLAESKSRQARDVVEASEYMRLFPGARTDRASRAVGHWTLIERRGGLLAVGVGGPITGHGALLGVIDDPFENWAQAQSLTYRDRVWDWYRTTFRTRIWEHGAMILVMTRWHADDLAGRLLMDQAGQWHVLRLPAIAETQEERDDNDAYLGLETGQADPLGREPGEALCPARFSLEALASLRRDVGELAWAAEYQGVPRPREGSLFRREWFEVVAEAPANATRVRFWDKAATEGGGDYTVGLRMARTLEGAYFVEDVARGQWGPDKREHIIGQMAAMDGQAVVVGIEQEGGSSGKDSARMTIRALAGHSVYAEHPTGDKLTRAEPFRAQCEAGNVKLVRGPWNMAYLDELTAVPNGAHDDQLDASSGAFNRLARRIGYKAW